MNKIMSYILVILSVVIVFRADGGMPPNGLSAKKIVAAFVNTPKSELPEMTDRLRRQLVTKKAKPETLKRLSAGIEAKVAAAVKDGSRSYRISEVRRCFACKQDKSNEFVLVSDGKTPSKFRLLLGSVIRGGVKATDSRCGDKSTELYGFGVDAQYNVWSGDLHNFWVGMGFAYVPKQRIGEMGTQTSDGLGTIVYRNTSLDVEYYEYNIMLNPEWRITDWLTLGPRVGVAFDWISLSGDYCAGMKNPIYPMIDYERSANIDSDELIVQGIVGLQLGCKVYKGLGIYANVDYRRGDDCKFTKKSSVDKGNVKFDLDGWHVGIGIFGEF